MLRNNAVEIRKAFWHVFPAGRKSCMREKSRSRRDQIPLLESNRGEKKKKKKEKKATEEVNELHR
jgi:hypothetical protein